MPDAGPFVQQPTTQTQASPSCLVVELADANALAVLETRLAGYRAAEEDGKTLTWIGGPLYVLARAVFKRMRSELGETGTLALLRGMQGIVARCELVAAPEVVRVMNSGLHASPPAAHPQTAEPGWNLKAVRAPEAWAKFPGGLGAAAWSAIRIGQLDTGYTPHFCLGFDDSGAPTPTTWMRADLGVNFYEPEQKTSGDPMLDSGTPGHGTRIGSVIGGYADRVVNGVKPTITGVAPRVNIVPYRVTNFVVIDTRWNRIQLGAALRHAVEKTGCQVINISLGDPCHPNAQLGRAIDDAYQEGILICCAAGNITSEVTYPGRYRRTLTAAGVSQNSRPWTGSARGPRVDVSAPADEVMRGLVTKQNNRLSFGFSSLDGDGTSYATAHLSGAAALWLAYHGKTLDDLYGRTWRRVEAFRTVLRNSASVPAGWNKQDFGAGLLDIVALLEAPLPDPATLRLEADIAADDIA